MFLVAAFGLTLLIAASAAMNDCSVCSESAVIRRRTSPFNSRLNRILFRAGEKHVVHLNSLSQLDEIIQSSGDSLIVIDFSASWCGPCQIIAPAYESLAQEYARIIFLKSDVDDAREVAEKFQISSMPTFVFIKSGSEVSRFSGASIGKLKETINSYA